MADVAYSNGADNGFMNELAKQGQLERLTAYNGWNTADNTVGFAICQGILTPQMSKPDAEKLMRIRVIDDWYYQANARRSATAFLESKNQKNAVYLLGPYQKPVHDLALGVCRDLSGRYKFTEKSNFDISYVTSLTRCDTFFEIIIHQFVKILDIFIYHGCIDFFISLK